MKFFNYLFFMDVSPLIKKGKIAPVEKHDMLELPDHLNPRSSILFDEKISWTTPRSLVLSLLNATKLKIIPAYIWYILSTLLSLATPLLLNHFIKLIGDGVSQSNLTSALLTGIALGFFGFMSGLLVQHYFVNTLGAHQIIVNVLNKKIFTHSLKLSMLARGKNQIGDIVNYMSSDSEAIADFSFIFGELGSNVLLVVGVVGMLFYFLGFSALAAFLSFFLLVPLTKFIAKKFTILEKEMTTLRDKRVSLMSQTLNAIRIVKYFAWEKSVEKEIMDIRNKELDSRKKLAHMEVLSGIGYKSISTIVLFIALSTHALRGQKIDAALIFTCVALFALLEGPFGDLSYIISRITGALVSAERILNFLSQEIILNNHEISDSSDLISNSVEFKNIHSYFEVPEKSVLKNINFEIEEGKSLAIIGPVGSGKSALLYTLLGEIKISSGKVSFPNHLRSNIAYLPQEAYIINSSLEENILFGNHISTNQLDHAINLSCLDSDISKFNSGLKTEIGEKGVNLSGGQKQRVGLARAFISDPQLIVLDDPLSAVDIDTEKKLCERLLFGEWRNKTRIIVTHRLSHLHLFDKILFIQDGEITASGNFNEIKKIKSFFDFYSEHNIIDSLDLDSDLKSVDEPSISIKQQNQERITVDEDREVGAVKSIIYFDYLKSLGGDNLKSRPWILSLLLISAIAVALTPLISKGWLSYYSSHQLEWKGIYAIGIYGILGTLVLVVGVINNFFWLDRGIKAGQNLHDQMLKSILLAPVRFFDSTPVGRILQRFSRDIESVDIYLQWSFIAVINCILQITVSIFLILALLPLMVLIIIPVLYGYYLIQKNYRSPAREAKRFDSVARSPRYSHFKETLQGLVVIRSFSKENWFLESFFEKLTESQKMSYSHYMLNRWFSSRIPIVGGIISISTTIGITLSSYYGMMTAGNAGLLTLYSLSFWAYLNWGLRMFTDIESRMTSIERLKYFANIPPEKSVLKNKSNISSHLSDKEYFKNWPNKGELIAKNLKIRYADHLPLVLDGVNFLIRAGTKVGVIGRTGSGKSTLFQSLFRFIELEEGQIIIDNLDISTVPLEILRKKMAIIPQDPTLFMGTIRNNLDRFNEFSDDLVISVLVHAGLWSFIQTLPLGLNTEVIEGAQNFSQGQKQLLCLARALLINAKIIIMDEATANVDVQTDSLLQKVIRKELSGITLLIIAHRLETVLDCDQIIKIENGKSSIVKEYKI